MASKMRYARAGNLQIPFNLTDGATAAGNRVERGDFVYFDGTSLKKASNWPWGTSDDATRKAITPQFAGVSPIENPVTNRVSREVALYTSGIFKFTIASSTYNHGQMVGIKGNGSSALYDNQVAIVTDPREAIGFIAKDYSSATTEVEVFLMVPYGEFGPYAGRMKSIAFNIEAAPFTAAADLVSDYTFGSRVKLIFARFIVSTATTVGTTVITFKNGANSLGNTLSIAASKAVGAIVDVVFADATHPEYEYFDSTDLLDIVSDGVGAGAGTLQVFYMNLPKIQ